MTLVAGSIATRDGSGAVDWPFLEQRTMQVKAVWQAEDRARHTVAQAALTATGYTAGPVEGDDVVTAVAEEIAEELEEHEADVAQHVANDLGEEPFL